MFLAFHHRSDFSSDTRQHQPGKLVGKDAAPEFSAETLPAGTAPASRTFKPNPVDDVPAGQNAPSASDTIGGATSADVSTGLGHPGSGQTSRELRHDGGKTQGSGLEGVGATANQSTINPHDPVHAGQRALDKDEAVIGRSDVPGAHERLPEGAESVASERK